MQRPPSDSKIVVGMLLLLLILGLALTTFGDLGLTGGVVNEELMFERLTFDYQKILVEIRNVGPIELAISTVFVNQAIWSFDVQPDRELGRFASATITIPYQWVYGETLTISLLTRPSNLEFSKTVDAVVLTPKVTIENFLNLAKVGLIVGVIPVFLGLLLLPLLRRIRTGTISLLLGFTVGLLAFLAIDALAEALEISSELPKSLSGIGIIVSGFAGMFLGLVVLNTRASAHRHEGASTVLTVAYLIALSIGLHNMGEGLAIGSAFALGAIAFGTRLIVGFAIHNTTEGLAIASPIIRQPVSLTSLVFMGLLAGVPSILGAWIGGFVRSDILALLFLAIGAGAILEVVYEILFHVKGMFTSHGYTGILIGLLLMSIVAFLVT